MPLKRPISGSCQPSLPTLPGARPPSRAPPQLAGNGGRWVMPWGAEGPRACPQGPPSLSPGAPLPVPRGPRACPQGHGPFAVIYPPRGREEDVEQHRSPPPQAAHRGMGHGAVLQWGSWGKWGHLRTPDPPAGNRPNPSKPHEVPALLLVPEDRPDGSSVTPPRAPKPGLGGADLVPPHCPPLGHLLRYFRAHA